MIHNLPSVFGQSFPSLFDKRFDEMFDELVSNRAINVEDVEGAKRVYIDLPGVKKEDVSIRTDRGLLHVRAERKGFVKGVYEKSYTLAQEFDSDRVSAELSDGVLVITLPLKDKRTPKTIAIK